MPAPTKYANYPDLKGQYAVYQTLGTGGFAKVKLGTHDITGENVAIKIMDKAALGDDLPRVKLEIEALKEFNHPNICKLYQVIETREKYFLVLEYCTGGELFDYIIERDRLFEKEARMFFRQIISAVDYIHKKGYAHRDLKPENLLLSHDQKLKLIDFGLCAKPESGMQQPLNTCCGSPAYAAPELITGADYNGNKVDIWSMGVLLYALLCGFLPFDDENVAKLYKKIQKGKYICPSWLSHDSQVLLSQMLQVNPEKRLSIDELKVHPWVIQDLVIPADWISPKEEEKYDEECVAKLAYALMRLPRSIEYALKKKKYDSLTATYYLLLLQKKENRPLYLKYYNDKEQSNVLQEKGQNIPFSKATNSSPVSNRVSSNSLRSSELSAFGSPVKISVNSILSNLPAACTPPRHVKASNKENFALPEVPSVKKKIKDFSSPVKTRTTKDPVPKPVTPLGLSASMDARMNEIGDTTPQIVSEKRAKSFDSPIATATPLRNPASSITSSAKKVFGSIEKGLGNMKTFLTPKRRIYCGKETPRKITKLCNVSSVSDKVNPDDVVNALQNALLRKGILCKQNGYTLGGKITDGRKTILKFELEVCRLSKHNLAVGIRRKRLEGDAWHYKKICEEVLKLASCDPVHGILRTAC